MVTTVTASTNRVTASADRTGSAPADGVVTLTADRLPPVGLGVQGPEHSTNGIASVSLIDDDTSARIVIAWLNPASRPVGGYADEIQLKLCYDDPCTRQVRGSPVVVASHYSVEQSDALSPASAFRAREVNLDASDIAWSPGTGRIYAAVQAASQVAVIDPESGVVERRVNLGGVPQKLAASDDGQYLYVSSGSGSVNRYRLPATP